MNNNEQLPFLFRFAIVLIISIFKIGGLLHAILLSVRKPTIYQLEIIMCQKAMITLVLNGSSKRLEVIAKGIQVKTVEHRVIITNNSGQSNNVCYVFI